MFNMSPRCLTEESQWLIHSFLQQTYGSTYHVPGSGWTLHPAQSTYHESLAEQLPLTHIPILPIQISQPFWSLLPSTSVLKSGRLCQIIDATQAKTFSSVNSWPLRQLAFSTPSKAKGPRTCAL